MANQTPSTADSGSIPTEHLQSRVDFSDARFVVHADRINARGAGAVGRGHAQPQPIGGHWLDPVYAAAKIVTGFRSHRFPSAFHIDREFVVTDALGVAK